ncbi:MAG: hypothetical protein RQ736_06700 [Thiogranum sp.]|nr:hypothetical protein [Thiogranum sp.]
MADLFSVTAPLAIRFPDGEKQIIVRCFPDNGGLIFASLYWDQVPEGSAFRFVAGPIRGDGPWKVGDAVITVLGCHGTDAELASEFAAWQNHLMEHPVDDARLTEMAQRFRQRFPSE